MCAFGGLEKHQRAGHLALKLFWEAGAGWHNLLGAV